MTAHDRPWHRCPAEGCRHMVADGYVACARHWLGLPDDTRKSLAAAFRRREQSPALYRDAVEKTLRLLGAA